METELYLEHNSVIEIGLGIEDKGPAHSFFTAECARYMDQFVPFLNGYLAETVIKNGVINEDNVNEDTIVYNQPYAEYVYYGIRSDGSREIMNYTKDKHENAGPIWDEVMWDIYADEITKSVQEYVEKYGGK